MADRTSRAAPDDDLRERPLEDPADSRAETDGERSDLEAELGPLGERTDPTNPPRENAPIGESGGAGMENPGNDRGDPGRERWRDIRM
jgi:hypothetical protein